MLELRDASQSSVGPGKVDSKSLDRAQLGWTTAHVHTKTACPCHIRSELVEVVTQRGHGHFQVLPLPDCEDEVHHFPLHRGITGHVVPVVEDTLREGLSARGGAECGDEAEGLGD